MSDPQPFGDVERHDVPLHGRSGFAVVEGRQVHYLEWGPSGAPAVLALHGGGQTGYMFEDLGAGMRRTHHVLAPDLPSHGDSDTLAEGSMFSRQSLASTLPPLLAEFGVGRCVIVGASLGGILALTLGAEHPDLVAGVVLVDVGHRLEEEGVLRIIAFMREHESFGSLEEAGEAISAYLPHRPAVQTSRLTRNLRRRSDGRWVWKHAYGRVDTRQEQRGADWRDVVSGLDEDAKRLQVPALVLRGAHSDVLSGEGAEEIAALIPDARLETVEKAGHLAAGDNPQTTVTRVTAFLSEIGW
jgi:pimeloyl-ACP methyl ester carboxylesterase